MFQSTPPQGGRPRHRSYLHTSARFQSTPPQGGRPISALMPNCTASFNPRPHKGGDKNWQSQFDITNVSIHAPTRGATLYITISLIRDRYGSYFANLPLSAKNSAGANSLFPPISFCIRQCECPNGYVTHSVRTI